MRAAIRALVAIESARARAVTLPAPARILSLQRLAEAAAMLETTADNIEAGNITTDVWPCPAFTDSVARLKQPPGTLRSSALV